VRCDEKSDESWEEIQIVCYVRKSPCIIAPIIEDFSPGQNR